MLEIPPDAKTTSPRKVRTWSGYKFADWCRNDRRGEDYRTRTVVAPEGDSPNLLIITRLRPDDTLVAVVGLTHYPRGRARGLGEGRRRNGGPAMPGPLFVGVRQADQGRFVPGPAEELQPRRQSVVLEVSHGNRHRGEAG